MTNQIGSIWFFDEVYIDGFDAEFTFLITDLQSNSETYGGQSGITFVIQDESSFELGPNGGGLGYGDRTPTGSSGIPKSIAIEIDTYLNEDLGDPNKNHISIHTRGNLPNSAYETYSIGSFIPLQNVRTSTPFKMTINYRKPLLNISFADVSSPIITNLTVDITNVIGSDGSAFLGFTSSTGSDGGDTHYIVDWSYIYRSVVDAGNSFAVGTPSTLEAGVEDGFWITSYDNYNHSEIIGGANISLFLDSKEQFNYSVTDYNNGSYWVRIECFVAQGDKIGVLLNGEGIKGSPFSISISSSVASSNYSTASGDGLHGGISGDDQQFEVHLFDQYGNIVMSDTNVTVQIGGEAEIQAKVGNNMNGVYTVDYKPVVVGIYSLSIFINQQLIGYGVYQFSISAGPVSPKDCSVTSIPGTIVAGNEVRFNVTTYDGFNNKITNKVNMEVQIRGENTLNLNIPNPVDASYFFNFQLTKSGLSTLRILINSIDLPGSPFTLNVATSSPDPSQTYITGPTKTFAGVPIASSILAYDVYGNAITDGKVNFNYRIEIGNTNNTFSSANLVYTSQNTYTLTANYTLSQFYTYAVFISTQPIKNSYSYVVTVDHSSVDATKSVITGKTTNSTKDEINQFQVTFYDRFGNVIASQLDYFVNITYLSGKYVNNNNNTGSNNNVEAIISNFQNGTYNVVWVPYKTGKYSIDASINNLPIPGFPWEVEVPGFRFTLPYIIVIIAACVGVIAIIAFIIIVIRRQRQRYTTL
eukprot:TRINITY_DN4047_c0_g1_i1.p1 TRINITY_DN4047_c0_g1~~TRINITY_DN4047_c0_g1_i1.p1  ORF type:complete len:808 (-),score=178.95 TRINITY_DN4047_c0_g1_i1:23-2284(-)